MSNHTPHDSILPLELTPFEWMMLVEDRSDYPMVAVIELQLQGEVDREQFEAAFNRTLQRHPLLTACVASPAGKPPQWVAAEPPKIDWQTAIEATPVGLPIDLRQTAGLRMRMVCDGLSTRQIVELHHACCDGTGIFQFLQELYLGYANLTAAETQPLELVECLPEQLRGRNHFPISATGSWQRLSRFAFGVREAVKFSLKKIAPLRSEPFAAEPVDNLGRQRTAYHLGSELLARLRRAAATSHTTLNDLLLRDLLLSIAEWNQGLGQKQVTYRLLVPCDLRTEEHQRLSASNVMGYSFVTRRSQDCNRSTATLEGIRDEMRFIREHNASLYFIRGLEFCQRYLGGIRSLAKPNHCFATAMVSNLGNPAQSFFSQLPSQQGKIRVGQLSLEKVVAYPPLRKNTRIGMVVNTYGNQLTIGLHCDPRSLSAADGQKFAELFQRNLAATALVSD